MVEADKRHHRSRVGNPASRRLESWLLNRATDGSLYKAEGGMPYFVVDQEAMMVMRGPYKYAETAGAVRSEMERHRDDRNYWICKAKSINDWYKKNLKGAGNAVQ